MPIRWPFFRLRAASLFASIRRWGCVLVFTILDDSGLVYFGCLTIPDSNALYNALN
ncbi:hypothetical protein Poly41_24180 [Novipirellula artificiosorum]|uniref:Uncharacterized protein n=1 Tax=Novipirellula artificiosorum TaxID=2528016 RepID=A0A5C6DQL0_9BACT|nr:hypothetical protein Poly41_24180 [Novipirellula artificiosorum]